LALKLKGQAPPASTWVVAIAGATAATATAAAAVAAAAAGGGGGTTIATTIISTRNWHFCWGDHATVHSSSSDTTFATTTTFTSSSSSISHICAIASHSQVVSRCSIGMQSQTNVCLLATWAGVVGDADAGAASGSITSKNIAAGAIKAAGIIVEGDT
jgi:hypothetical protein